MTQLELQTNLNHMKQGDREGFTQIYHGLKTPVYTIVLRIVGDRAAAEDIMQETFLKLYTNPPGSEVKNPRAWIFRVAQNLAIDARRRKTAQELPEGLPSGDDLAREVGLRLDLTRAFGALEEDSARIVSLHLTAGLTFGEIAAIEARSLAAVYRIYRKGIKELRKQLNGGKDDLE